VQKRSVYRAKEPYVSGKRALRVLQKSLANTGVHRDDRIAQPALSECVCVCERERERENIAQPALNVREPPGLY